MPQRSHVIITNQQQIYCHEDHLSPHSSRGKQAVLLAVGVVNMMKGSTVWGFLHSPRELFS